MKRAEVREGTTPMQAALDSISRLTSKAEIKAVFDYARAKWKELDARDALIAISGGLAAGAKVSFTGNRGERLTGTVVKLARNKALVDVGGTKWRVPIGALAVLP